MSVFIVILLLGCLSSPHNAFDSQSPVEYTPTFSSGSCGMYSGNECRTTGMAIQKRGKLLLEGVQRASDQETLMDSLWGTNCHSKALSALKKECRDLRPTEKSRLALMLLFCQLVHVQGHHERAEGLTCRPGDLLKSCVNRLDDREHAMYVEMLTHIDTMCLYIQNQDFEKFAEHMLNKIVRGSHSVAQRMTDIHNDLGIIRDNIRHQRDMQRDMFRNMSAGIELMELSHERQKKIVADALSSIYFHSMRLIQESTTRLENIMEASSHRIHGTFQAIREEANEAAVAQEAIKHDLQAIQRSTTTLGSLFQSMHEYQKRTDRVLSKVLGSSYSVQDGLFFGSGILVVVAMGSVGVSLETRAYVCIWLGVSLILERSILNVSDVFKYHVGLYEQYAIISDWLQATIMPQWACSMQFLKTAIRKIAGAIVLYMWVRRPTPVLRRRCRFGQHMGEIELHHHHPLPPIGRRMRVRPIPGRRAFSEQVYRPHRGVEVEDDAQSMPRFQRAPEFELTGLSKRHLGTRRNPK